MYGNLPETLVVNDKEYEIRTCYQDIIPVLIAFNDPELNPQEKAYVLLKRVFYDYENIPSEDIEEAYSKAIWFVDGGRDYAVSETDIKTMDWKHDEFILFAEINKIAGMEVRKCKDVHWWTFLGYYMEIGDGVFLTIVNLRKKKAKNQKMEKWEKEFWDQNKALCELDIEFTQEEKDLIDYYNQILG